MVSTEEVQALPWCPWHRHSSLPTHSPCVVHVGVAHCSGGVLLICGCHFPTWLCLWAAQHQRSLLASPCLSFSSCGRDHCLTHGLPQGVLVRTGEIREMPESSVPRFFMLTICWNHLASFGFVLLFFFQMLESACFLLPLMS